MLFLRLLSLKQFTGFICKIFRCIITENSILSFTFYIVPETKKKIALKKF